MKRIYFLVLSAFLSTMALAQEKTDINADINKGGGGFPWLWVVGAAVFIILLVALLGGGRSSDRIIERKTIVKE